MRDILHIIGGDICGASLQKAGLPGKVFIWHDILYDGPQRDGWPDEKTLEARAAFIQETTGGGLDKDMVMNAFRDQYEMLAGAAAEKHIVLWFDACLFDQAMLVHLLACLKLKQAEGAELICVDAFPGIEPFIGLGQMSSEQLASVYDTRTAVTDEQYDFTVKVDKAFGMQDTALLKDLADMEDAPLPWIPAAAKRWLEESPDPETGLGRLETMTLAAVRSGCDTASEIYKAVSASETQPQYWGDTTLWAKINALADKQPALVSIAGPAERLPVWESELDVGDFRITPMRPLS